MTLLIPGTLSAHCASDGVRKVYARCEDTTPMAWSTALRESRLNTAGWLTHSKAASSSASRAVMVEESTAATGVMVAASEDGVETERAGSGKSEDRGEDERGEFAVRMLLESVVDLGAPGGKGGRPPFPRPLRILRVSVRRWCARSCWLRAISVSARWSMSDERSSIRRWTMEG